MKHKMQMVLFTLMFGNSGSALAFEMMQLASDNPQNFAMERQLIESARECSWKSGASETTMSKVSPEMQSFLLSYSDLADKPKSNSKLCIGKVVCPTTNTITKMDVKFQTASEIVCHFNEESAKCDAKACFLKTTDYKENMDRGDRQFATDNLKKNPTSETVDTKSNSGLE